MFISVMSSNCAADRTEDAVAVEFGRADDGDSSNVGLAYWCLAVPTEFQSRVQASDVTADNRNSD